jgi:hypothetical protein
LRTAAGKKEAEEASWKIESVAGSKNRVLSIMNMEQESQIERESVPLCLKCGEIMESGNTTYYFYRDLWRIDVMYFFCQRDNVAELDEKSLDSNKIFQQRVADKEGEIKKIDEWLHSMFRYNRKEI